MQESHPNNCSLVKQQIFNWHKKYKKVLILPFSKCLRYHVVTAQKQSKWRTFASDFSYRNLQITALLHFGSKTFSTLLSVYLTGIVNSSNVYIKLVPRFVLIAVAIKYRDKVYW